MTESMSARTRRSKPASLLAGEFLEPARAGEKAVRLNGIAAGQREPEAGPGTQSDKREALVEGVH